MERNTANNKAAMSVTDEYNKVCVLLVCALLTSSWLNCSPITDKFSTKGSIVCAASRNAWVEAAISTSFPNRASNETRYWSANEVNSFFSEYSRISESAICCFRSATDWWV